MLCPPGAGKEAADAQVIVANHHILFSDLAARMDGAGYEATAVLPPFRILVMDEAHAIEASATSFFSEAFNRFVVHKLLSRITRNRRGNRGFGVVARLMELHNFPSRPASRPSARGPLQGPRGPGRPGRPGEPSL